MPCTGRMLPAQHPQQGMGRVFGHLRPLRPSFPREDRMCRTQPSPGSHPAHTWLHLRSSSQQLQGGNAITPLLMDKGREPCLPCHRAVWCRAALPGQQHRSQTTPGHEVCRPRGIPCSRTCLGASHTSQAGCSQLIKAPRPFPKEVYEHRGGRLESRNPRALGKSLCQPSCNSPALMSGSSQPGDSRHGLPDSRERAGQAGAQMWHSRSGERYPAGREGAGEDQRRNHGGPLGCSRHQLGSLISDPAQGASLTPWMQRRSRCLEASGTHGGAEAGGDIELTQPRAACTVLGTVGFPISPWRETLLPLRAACARV